MTEAFQLAPPAGSGVCPASASLPATAGCKHWHILDPAGKRPSTEPIRGVCKYCGDVRTWPRDPAYRSVAGHTMRLWAHADKERVKGVG